MLSPKDHQQRRQEAEWNRILLTGNEDFNSVRSARRAYVTVDMDLVSWTVAYGQAIVKAHYKVVEIFGGSRGGFTVKLLRIGAGAGPETFSICHIPRQLPESRCFVWVPRYADVRYLPSNPADIRSELKLTLSVMFGSCSRFETPVEGHDYFTFAGDVPALRQESADA